MPMVGHRFKCGRCREEATRPRSVERIRLKTGPNGERLCVKHFNEAWDEYMEENHD